MIVREPYSHSAVVIELELAIPYVLEASWVWTPMHVLIPGLIATDRGPKVR